MLFVAPDRRKVSKIEVFGLPAFSAACWRDMAANRFLALLLGNRVSTGFQSLSVKLLGKRVLEAVWSVFLA